MKSTINLSKPKKSLIFLKYHRFFDSCSQMYYEINMLLKLFKIYKSPLLFCCTSITERVQW